MSDIKQKIKALVSTRVTDYELFFNDEHGIATEDVFVDELVKLFSDLEAEVRAEERTKIYKHLCEIWDKGEVPTVEWRESLVSHQEDTQK